MRFPPLTAIAVRRRKEISLDPNLMGAIIGVGGSLVGILAGGLIAFLTLRTQLRHEAKEKERERKLTLRRDVYLEAMEAIGRSQLFLGTFSREDFEIGKLLEQLQDIPGALSKAQLVAAEETFAALDRFGDFMMSSTVDLLALRLRVHHLQGEIAAQNEHIAQLESQDELAAAHDRLQRLTQRNVEATERLGREAIKATLDAQAEAGKVILQIRKEIELPLQEEWYLSRLAEKAGRLQPKIDQIYKDVDAVFEESANL